MHLEHLLTEEQRQLRQTIRDFTRKEIIPFTRQLEEDYSLVEKVHQKLVDIGVQASAYPVEYGGGGINSMTHLAIIAEELSKGDAGIALSACSNTGGTGPAGAVGCCCQGKMSGFNVQRFCQFIHPQRPKGVFRYFQRVLVRSSRTGRALKC